MAVPVRSNCPGTCRRLRLWWCALFLPLAVSAAHGDVPIRLNEILINPFGADRGQEFIEISGPPGASMAGLSIVVIEGDATATSSVQKGRIDNVLNLGALEIGQSGLLLLRDGIGIIDCDPGPELAGPLPTTRTVIFPSSATQSGFGNGSVGLENSSSTFLLVSGFTGAVGQDLDTDNDGTLDILPWSEVLDAVSVINSSSGPIGLAVGYAPQFGGLTLSALTTGYDIPMLVRRDDGSWITAPIIGVNPTTGPPISGESGPYYWQPGLELPAVGGVQYLMTPGRPNGDIPNGQSPCGSLRVTVTEGTNHLWSNWGYPTFDLDGSPVQFDVPPGGSIRQGVGAAVRASFTAPIACRYRFDLCGSGIEDTVMVALGTCGDAATAFAANDEAEDVCGEGSSRSAFDLILEAGQQVDLALGSYMSSADIFPLETGSLALRIRRDTDSDGAFDDEDGCPDEPGLIAPREYHIDADGDGYGRSETGLVCAMSAPPGYSDNGEDCDDDDPASYPGAPEVCDGADNDCDTLVDEGVQVTAYADQDGDGAGDPDASILVCTIPDGYVGNADDGCPFEPALTQPATYYRDADGDGFGAEASAFCALVPPPGFSALGGDCDDASPAAYPGAPELCATIGVDNDCDGDVGDVSVPDVFYVDADGDGYGAGAPVEGCPMPPGHSMFDGDCDDADPVRSPGAPESCDDIGVDNDCDGDADEVTDPRTYYRDADGDGAGDPLQRAFGCEPPDGYVGNADDECPDDPKLVAALVFHPDSDGDGYGAAQGVGHCALTPPPGFLVDSSDCDDSRADVYPGAVELCANWGIDNDCDGDAYDAQDLTTFYFDADGDGFGDSAVTVQSCQAPPGYVSVGGDGCPLNPFAQAPIGWYRDQDNDSFGNPNVSIVSCVQPAGYIPQNTDCDDTRPWVNPLAQERCDPLDIDEDCDGLADDDDPSAIGKTPWYLDADGDTYGAGVATMACDAPSAQHIPRGGDCNDDPEADGQESFPGAPELCASVGTDNNCNGDAYDVDADASDKADFFLDADGDGYGDASVSVRACAAPDGYVSNADDDCPDEPALATRVPFLVDEDGDGFGGTVTDLLCTLVAPAGYSPAGGDCNDDPDADGAESYPGAAELCANVGTDNNCDGDAYDVDTDASDLQAFFLDADGDGFGVASKATRACETPSGYAPVAGDCDDSLPEVNPGAAEVCNGIDDDCANGIDDGLEFRDYFEDTDGDGYGDDGSEVNACVSPGEGWVEVGGDSCPDDPAKVEAGDCGCGVADDDVDGDAVADCNDNCGDLYNPAQADCDGDGYGDACAIEAGAPDCDGNGIPDSCAIASGSGSDVDGNGELDACQEDCNGDGLPDEWQVMQGLVGDCNGNGIPDDCEDGSVRADTGHMGALAGGQSVSVTLEGQGLSTTAVHVQVDLVADFSAEGAAVELSLNGIPIMQVVDAGGASCPDLPQSSGLELSAVQWAQVIDAASAAGEVLVRLMASDQVGDTVCSAALARVRIWYGGAGYDCDGDGEPDLCQLASGEGDCDGNGTYDACEAGGPGDTDSDGIPDSCETSRGDFNLDGIIDGTDLAFVLGAWGTLGSHPADLNGDGIVFGEDLAFILAAWGPLTY